MGKTYIDVPHPPPMTRARAIANTVAATILTPPYLLMAHRCRTPGLLFHLDCALLGLRLLFRKKNTVPTEMIYAILFHPMDSTRYFEFDFVWNALSSEPFNRYLDVSSPRLFPILLVAKRPEVAAEMINPDGKDILQTESLVRALGLESRCRLTQCLVGSAPLPDGAFDVVTSISVLEHIPEDTGAIRKMWSLLRPGGRLLLSVPCAAESSEQYISENPYGVLEPGDDGYTFWQRFYDDEALQERIFRITGRPRRYGIYGEVRPGTFRRNAYRKISDPHYPFWREPYMMGREYRYFGSVGELPGEGVIAMEFVKQ